MKYLTIIILLLNFSLCGWSMTTARSACMSNLKQIESAVLLWASENNLTDTNSYTLSDTNITVHLNRGVLPKCLSGGSYSAGTSLADEIKCPFHGSADDLHREYLEARRRQLWMQCATSALAVTIAWCLLKFLGRIKRAGRMSEAVYHGIVPGLILLLALFSAFWPQYLLRPAYGIVQEIQYVPMLVLSLIGLGLIFKHRQKFSFVSFLLAGIFLVLIYLVMNSWR